MEKSRFLVQACVKFVINQISNLINQLRFLIQSQGCHKEPATGRFPPICQTTLCRLRLPQIAGNLFVGFVLYTICSHLRQPIHPSTSTHSDDIPANQQSCNCIDEFLFQESIPRHVLFDFDALKGKGYLRARVGIIQNAYLLS